LCSFSAMDQLGELKGLSGLGALGNVAKNEHTKDKEKPKDNTKAKKEVDQ